MKFNFFIISIILFICNKNIYSCTKDRKIFDSIKISGTIGNIYNVFFDQNKINEDYPITIHFAIKEKNYINNKSFAFGNMEIDFSLTNQKYPISYLSYFGLDLKSYGNISYGKNYNILYDILSWTNVNPLSEKNILVAKKIPLRPIGNTITYRNDDIIKHLQLSFQYQKQIKNRNKQFDSTLKQVINNFYENRYGTSVIYNINHEVSFGASFIKNFFLNNNITENIHRNNHLIYTNKCYDLIYSLGVKYIKSENLYVSAIHTEKVQSSKNFTKNLLKERIRISELAIKYKFSRFLHTFINIFSEKNNYEINKNKKYLKNFIEFGINYIFNEKILSFLSFKTYISDKFMINKKDNFLQDRSILIGIIYQF